MWRKISTENLNVVPEGIEFTFDTQEEAQSFYQECQEKMTDAEINGSKVTLLITSRDDREKQQLE